MIANQQKGTMVKKLLSISVLLSLMLFVSCTQQTPSGGNSMSAEDRAHLDGLKEEVKQLRETNKDLAARLEKQSGALETLKMLTDTYDKRVEKVREDMSWQTNALNNVVQYFSDQLTRQQTTISNLAWQIIILNLKSSDNGEAVFDAADSTGFSRINSESGFFLVSLKNVEPYLDGYRVTVKVGNPLSADYSNLKFDVSWGKKYESKDAANDPKAFQNWQASLHTKEISMPDKLLSGSWNMIQLVLSPAKSDELGYISIKLSTKTASLRTPLEKP